MIKSFFIKIFVIVSALFLMQGQFINAQEKSKTEPVKVKYECGPYLQNVTDTSFTVIWTTNMDAVSWVEIAPDDNTNWYNCERPKYYDLRGCGRRPITKVHKITVTGLEPNTTYRYRIMMEGVSGAYNRVGVTYTPGYGKDILRHPETKVHTKAFDYDKLHIGVVNDMHEGDSILRLLFADAKDQKYDFVVYNGDMTSEIADQRDLVKNYLKSSSELFASDTPLFLMRGNHEYRGNDALEYLNYIETPTGKTYYTAKYGKFYFIFLDSGEDKCDSDIRNLGVMITNQYTDEEAKWLKHIVQTKEFKDSEVRIVFSHIQPNLNGWYGNKVVAEKFVPILNKAGIDLMLCGHIHRYKFFPVGSTNAEFPVICNKNRELMVLDIDSNGIDVNFFDKDHKLVRNLNFNK